MKIISFSNRINMYQTFDILQDARQNADQVLHRNYNISHHEIEREQAQRRNVINHEFPVQEQEQYILDDDDYQPPIVIQPRRMPIRRIIKQAAPPQIEYIQDMREQKATTAAAPSFPWWAVFVALSTPLTLILILILVLILVFRKTKCSM